MYVQMSTPHAACRRVKGAQVAQLPTPMACSLHSVGTMETENGDLLRENAFLFRRVKIYLFIYFLKKMTHFRRFPRESFQARDFRVSTTSSTILCDVAWPRRYVHHRKSSTLC